ncbi:MAG: hypothetical protein JRJ19_12260, partial [Deltaproteobacteria bacterium]|nr:hypothetical protein [Deltaproteobacteria bacterium]
MRDRGTRKILLVGDLSKAFLETDTVTEGLCEICPNISDAVSRAAKGDFAAITVVMFGISGRLSSAL